MADLDIELDAETLRSFAAMMRQQAREALQGGGMKAVLTLAHEQPDWIPEFAQALDLHVAEVAAKCYQTGLEARFIPGDETPADEEE